MPFVLDDELHATRRTGSYPQGQHLVGHAARVAHLYTVADEIDEDLQHLALLRTDRGDDLKIADHLHLVPNEGAVVHSEGVLH